MLKGDGAAGAAARQDRIDLRGRGTSGATSQCQREVFPCGFFHHVEDSVPSHHFTVKPTADGAASVAAAQPRIAAAGGGAAIRDLGC